MHDAYYFELPTLQKYKIVGVGAVTGKREDPANEVVESLEIRSSPPPLPKKKTEFLAKSYKSQIGMCYSNYHLPSQFLPPFVQSAIKVEVVRVLFISVHWDISFAGMLVAS